jgi:type IV pilus assembly protein PilV
MHPIGKIHQKHSRGAGLVEVLVAVVVIAIGMLGIASMYVTTLGAKTTSLSRTKAINLAYDMGDRIRANPTGGTSYNLARTAATTAVNCSTATCTSAQIAASDLDQWNSIVTSSITGLPQAGRSVVYTPSADSATPDIYTIQLWWFEKGAGTLTISYPVQICSRTQNINCLP